MELSVKMQEKKLLLQTGLKIREKFFTLLGFDEIKGDTITKIAKKGANIKLTNDNKFMSYPFINQ